MKSLSSISTLLSLTLTQPFFQVIASPAASLAKPLAKPDLNQIFRLSSLIRNVTESPTWPTLPYTIPLPHIVPPSYPIPPAHVVFTKTHTPILSSRQTELFRLLLIVEAEYLTKYPHQFNPLGISTARTFTEIFLTCHQASDEARWTLEVAVEMLRAVESELSRWGVRGFSFEVWVGRPGVREMYCTVWAQEGRRRGVEDTP